MTNFNDFWQSLGHGARWGLVAGMLAIAGLLAGASWLLLRTDYEVLFADLKPQDAASIVAELDKMKVPYKLASGGAAVLVEASAVHGTRLKLMGKEVPLHGAVGFELFNNADFGMTEFAQKINYQRALQGEITRTILSLAEVQEARVHLALPEEGLFKRSTSKAKAAITLGLRPGKSLRAEQISGIQRLVSSAVPGIGAQDVTIVNQQGVALTRNGAAEADGEPDSGRLALKKETEQLLARKATDVLDRAFGAGQAIASVDVVLNLDQVRTTTEDVLGAPGANGQGSSGVMTREREVMRGEPVAPLDARRDAGARNAGSQREVDYQVGRRIEQVVSLPGAIRKLQVVAVVPRTASPAQAEQLRALLAAAVGAVPERGDVVIVQSVADFAAPANAAVTPASWTGAAPGEAIPVRAPISGRAMGAATMDWSSGVVVTALALFAGLVAWGILARQRRAGAGRSLSSSEREQLLDQLRHWLEADLPAQGTATQQTVVHTSGRTAA